MDDSHETSKEGTSAVTNFDENEIHMEEHASDHENVVQNLHIAHEIAMNSELGTKEVRIEDMEQKDHVWTMVREHMHSAFWDIFKEEISRDPPILTMAFLLLKDIKESLFTVMTPNLTKLKTNVEEVLDLDLLKQQAEHGAMDVQSNAQFVISVMSKICAPIRDQNIVKLSNETDIVAIFRGILETLNLMKLDLINYTIKSITPEILSNQMEYERNKFADFVELMGGRLPITESWLSKHKQGNNNFEDIMYSAFVEILSWKSEDPFPETFFMDSPRLNILKREYYKLTVAASVVIISLSCTIPDLATDKSFKELLKMNVNILLNGITSDETLTKIIPNIIEQIKQDANTRLTQMEKEKLSDFHSTAIEQQITEVVHQDNKIRCLVCKRVNDFLKSSLSCPRGSTNFPPALILFQTELETLNLKFKHVVRHNMAVCTPHYARMIEKLE